VNLQCLCTYWLYADAVRFFFKAGCEVDGAVPRTNVSAEESGDSFSQVQESQSDNGSLQNQPTTPSITRVPSQVWIIVLFNPLKTEFFHNFIHKSSSYLTGNTLLHHYKTQPVNAVWGKSHCLL
jgi:hypothetical protein